MFRLVSIDGNLSDRQKKTKNVVFGHVWVKIVKQDDKNKNLEKTQLQFFNNAQLYVKDSETGLIMGHVLNIEEMDNNQNQYNVLIFVRQGVTISENWFL